LTQAGIGRRGAAIVETLPAGRKFARMDAGDASRARLGRAHTGLKGFWTRRRFAMAGIAFFLLVTLGGGAILDLEASRLEARRSVELVSFGSLLQARLTRELRSALSLTGGLKSYLAVREGRLDPREVNAILEKLYGETRYVRNFGVAVGYRLTYVFPVKGNERVVGLDYRQAPAQWPGVKSVIEGGVPVLLGPVELIQGGKGLIYRVPVLLDGRYWGLISTVMDAESLFADTFGRAASGNVELAVRGRDGRGLQGDAVWGDARLFERRDVELIDVDVPGGKWVIALRGKTSSTAESELWNLRLFVWALAAFLGWGVYALLTQRARLARLAMFDALTGLPNRGLIEDRLERAISMQRRNPATVSALLFLDLDGFKDINDRYGHRAGDAVLQGVAERALRAVRDVDSVGRWGGDEIVVLLENAERQKIPELIERVRSAAESPINFAGNELKVGASIGLVILPDDGESAYDLLRLADRRMYENKEKRKRSSQGG
jgi:diguanylate cyclase (GGDEF)-like protein